MFAALILTSAVAMPLQDTIVVRRGAPAWGNNVAITREVRIGSVDGAEEYTFGQVAAVAASPDGTVYVLDASIPIVRVFDRAGRYVRSLGRRGQGPGEFTRPETVLATQDRVAVRDPGNARITVFPAAGGNPQHWPYQSNSFSNFAMMELADGGIGTPNSIRRNNEWRPVFLRYAANGTLRDTVWAPDLRVEPRQLVVQANGGTARYDIPNVPKPTWTPLADGGFAGGLPNRPAIIVVRPGRVYRLEWSAQPVRVSRQELEQQQAAMVDHIRRANDPAFRWSGPGIPDVKPYFSRIHVDADQRLWVAIPGPSRRVEASGSDNDSYVSSAHYEVYDRDLRYLGVIRLPDGAMLAGARGNELWTIDRDMMGVQYAARYRIGAR
jgi:hypothetical protein